MSELGTSPPPPRIYLRMSTHGEMPVNIYNNAVCGFNTFYKQPKQPEQPKQPSSLGTIPETEENCNKTVAEVMRSPRT